MRLNVSADGIAAFNAGWAAAIDVLRGGFADAKDDAGSTDEQDQANAQGVVTGFWIVITSVES